MDFEIRAGVPVEIREADDGGAIKVEGYAAVFGEEADIGGFFREVIQPGAFDGALSESDVPFLINHDGLPLARTGSGTLDLSIDERGLKIATELDPDDPDVQSIVGKMRRGDLDKMSFAFTVARQEWDETGETPLRKILEFDRIFDVSIVTEPAYKGTEIGLRSLEAHRKAERAENGMAAYAERVRRRMRMNLALREREG
ncbi:HK97 family phage prohead protease [Maritimibacter sp. DP07]|uniref:HK97 family phage prohead protease n=1 Tax=Maritimibacter harenae TaxID=2606218 RepID=A0A845M969_9RHOB|nr:HK97 family phage prohead protease [Maritimibacter harenae]MZR14233.1 HK97 family phage prohead protease [Maritimibacter harenae]